MYSADMTWLDWSLMAENDRARIQSALNTGLVQSEKWAAFAYGKSDADIATALGKNADDIANLRLCFGAFKSISDIVNGIAAQPEPFNFTGYFSPF